jgi:hypothetical protein
MPAIQGALVVLQKALPALAKQLPKLWPLLLESKNREKVASLARDLASASPKRKLAARMSVTEMLAQSLRLDMPVEGLKARRTHRSALHDDLGALHQEMSEALRN